MDIKHISHAATPRHHTNAVGAMEARAPHSSLLKPHTGATGRTTKRAAHSGVPTNTAPCVHCSNGAAAAPCTPAQSQLPAAPWKRQALCDAGTVRGDAAACAVSAVRLIPHSQSASGAPCRARGVPHLTECMSHPVRCDGPTTSLGLVSRAWAPSHHPPTLSPSTSLSPPTFLTSSGC